MSNNHAVAKKYYNKSIANLKQLEESIELGAAYANAGYEFYNTNVYDTAFLYFKESGRVFRKLDYQVGVAYSMGNIGMVQAKTGRHQLAEMQVLLVLKNGNTISGEIP